MIDWLEIKQFIIADHLELEFDSRFTTVTGETGSGKSLIVDAIAILLGQRSDNSYIRHNHDTAELQASFDFPPAHPCLHWLEQHGMANDNECLLRRVLRLNKSSKSYINGHAATVAQLRDIGKNIVDIHGQNEHHSLLKKSAQQMLLDGAADNLTRVAELGDCYHKLATIQKQIDQLNDQSQTTQERADLLKFQIEELNELAPESDEWLTLENQHKRLNYQQELTTGTEMVAKILYQSEEHNLNRQLVQCGLQLEQLSQLDNQLKPIIAIIDEAQVNIEEAANQLRPFYQDSEIDEEEIETIETRFSLYHSLARKHRLLPQLLADHHESMKRELTSLTNPQIELERLNALLKTASEKYQRIATKISTKRNKSAKHIAKQVTALIQELGMKGGKFDILLAPVGDGAYTKFGNETVEFVVTANLGQPLQPLTKVASGGELSRISLAIQVVLANKAPVSTLIFDEVDVGIGGTIAHIIGQKLKELGQSCQVICITHLSQVAAQGDHHFSVSKQGDKQVVAQVTKLTTEQRIEEIARMTGGKKITTQSLAHAQQMLEST